MEQSILFLKFTLGTICVAQIAFLYLNLVKKHYDNVAFLIGVTLLMVIAMILATHIYVSGCMTMR